MSPEAYDFITKLLDKNPKTRLGSKGGFKEVMTHPWMDKIDTQALLQKKLRPPYIPSLYCKGDVSHFDKVFTDEEAKLTSPALMLSP